MDKNFDHHKYEAEIYKAWEDLGAFSPAEGGKPFTIIMPPPNANDPLHIGHAMFVTIEDIFIRYHRMLGEASLWLPGTDHAGIETQYVFEKKLARQDKSRFDFDRETLYQMIWDYVQENSGVAVEQMKRLGASADWSRFKFTLDPDVVEFVVGTFVKMHEDNLIYRGERLVNYCPKCGTGYSELEVEYVERTDPFYYIKYGPITIATARPETKFRDTALAVNPKDKRYKKFLGQTIEIAGLLGPVKMTVIPDEEVDMEFGTGIMKVTPAHDPHDFELGQKFNLPVTPIITPEGRMDFSWYLESDEFGAADKKYQERARMYHGLKVAEMRKVMAEHLREDGLLVKMDENYSHRIGTCYRCHSVIEPIPLPQFFVRVKPLVEMALAALDNKETKILGTGREKILRHWLNNLKDWNISRQIVWGIRIPIWYSTTENPDLIVKFLDGQGRLVKGRVTEVMKDHNLKEISQGLQSIVADKSAKYVVSSTSPGEEYVQETDTFDTWFSSGQWPVVTLKTTRPGDFESFYPTQVMETAYDILPIWVMRMMMMGVYLTGKSPFEWVYLHGLIRDEQGRKMSKSIGNVINPLESVEKFGADAVRMALVMSSTPGTDKNIGENTIRGMRNLSNKIWNAARFVNEFSPTLREAGIQNSKFRERLDEVIKEVTVLMNNLKPGQAAEKLYAEFWHWYCDEVIEEAKTGKISRTDLIYGLIMFLKMLHPFMPFVTETVWGEIRDLRKNPEQMLINSSWPK